MFCPARNKRTLTQRKQNMTDTATAETVTETAPAGLSPEKASRKAAEKLMQKLSVISAPSADLADEQKSEKRVFKPLMTFVEKAADNIGAKDIAKKESDSAAMIAIRAEVSKIIDQHLTEIFDLGAEILAANGDTMKTGTTPNTYGQAVFGLHKTAKQIRGY